MLKRLASLGLVFAALLLEIGCHAPDSSMEAPPEASLFSDGIRVPSQAELDRILGKCPDCEPEHHEDEGDVEDEFFKIPTVTTANEEKRPPPKRLDPDMASSTPSPYDFKWNQPSEVATFLMNYSKPSKAMKEPKLVDKFMP